MKNYSGFIHSYRIKNTARKGNLFSYSIILFLFLFILLPPHIDAAITVDASSYVVAPSKTATTASWSHTVGTGSNTLLAVGVSVENPSTQTNNVTSVTYGGTALTRIGTQSLISGTSFYLTEIWYLLSPASGTATITVNVNNSASIVAGAVSFTGVNLSNPTGTFISTTGNGKSASVNAATVAGDMVLDTLTTTGGGRFANVGAGQTIRWNPAPGGGAGWVKGEGSTELATGSSTTMSWTSNKNSPWSLGAIPIHAALPALIAAKGFSATTIPINGATNMTITFTNPNTTSVTGVAFTDNYPSAMINTAATPSSNTCGGTVTMTNGGSSLALSGGTISASGSCSIVVPVTATTAGIHTNSTGAITAASTLPGTAATATLTALAPPAATKNFSPDTILINNNSTITVTLTNSNATAITGVAFTDTYPSGLVNDTSTSPATTTCGGAVTAANGGNTLSLSGGTIPASGSCTVTVNVQGTAAGSFLNSTGSITTTNAGTGSAASATLLVVNAPTAIKSFSPNVIPKNGTSVMTVTMINASGTPITGMSFSDTYPANMVNTTSASPATTCGGAVTAADGGNSLSLSGGTIPASSSCKVTVNVTSSIAGSYLNHTGTITTNEGDIAEASATLTVMDPPTTAKSFSPAVFPVSGTTNMTITLTNPNATSITGAAFTDTYPSTNMQNTAGTPSSNTCGGTVTMTNGGSSLALSGGTIPASGSCSIVVPVTATVAGTYTNSTGSITTTNAGTDATGASATLTAMSPPTIAKSFSSGSILPGVSTNMTITLTNPNSTADITGVTFTDTYPYGMTNNASSPSTNTCGWTVNMTNGGSSLGVSGMTIPASASCTITVPVTSTSYGSNMNSTGSVTTTNAGTGTAASATLIVITPPLISKAFSPTIILPGGATTITFDITNPNTSLAMTGIAFTDSYPANMKNTAGTPTTNTCSGATVTMVNNGTSFALSNLTLAASASCSITVPVTSTSAGTYTNSTGSVTTTNAGTGDADEDILYVLGAASATKQFLPDTIAQGATSVLLITLSNPNTTDIKNVAFTDTYPTNLNNTSSASPFTDCGGIVSATNGGTSVSLSGGTIPASGSCTVMVNVTSTTSGTYNNSTGTITTKAGNIAAASATLTVYALPNLLILKSADKSSANPGDVITYTIQVTNTGAGPAKTVTLTDNLGNYTALAISAYSGSPFNFTDGSPVSGLTLGTLAYSSDHGVTYNYTPLVSGAGGAPAGYDGLVTDWKIIMNNNMNGNGGNFTLNYKVIVK